MKLNKRGVYILLVLVVILILLIVFNYTTNCKSDMQCFNSHALKCSKAKLMVDSNGDMQRFEIIGPRGDFCVMSVSMVKVTSNTNPDIKNFLEGKGMMCNVPKSEIAKTPVTENKDLNTYCTGPLKEAILQINLDKLYDFVVKSIGPTAMEQYSVNK